MGKSKSNKQFVDHDDVEFDGEPNWNDSREKERELRERRFARRVKDAARSGSDEKED